MAASPKRIGLPATATTPLPHEPALRPTRDGDPSRRSPARELQNTLAITIASPPGSEHALSVPARIAVIATLASLSWVLIGGAVYLAAR